MDKFELLAKLVSFDTTSRNSNLALISFVQTYLQSYGLDSSLTFNEQKSKANLFTTFPAKNNSKTGGVIFSGHTDVVPIDGQIWESDPFSATEKEGLIYGRGTCDMKGFIAVLLSLVPEILKIEMQKPVHFAFSYDEEIGCIGVPSLIENVFVQKLNPEICIVGEPTSMVPVIAHKGINVFRCCVHGKAAHSSLTPQGCNAIDYAADLICKIREITDHLKTAGEKKEHYDVPFSSMSTNMIQGGNAMNTIPEKCEFIFELRNLPHLKPQEILGPIHTYVSSSLLPKMQKEYVGANIKIDTLAAAPGLRETENTHLIELTLQLTKQLQPLKVAYATEAGLFQNKGISTIVCGPGNIEQAHRANEFISKAQMHTCEVFLMDFIKRYNSHS